MLIEYRITNFRSIRDTQTLSMVASSIKERRDSNTFDSGQQAFPRILKSGVVYGPNAAGKSNVLQSLLFMKAFVLGSAAPNTVGQKLHIKPFLFDKKNSGLPTAFEAIFVEAGVRYQYGFSLVPDGIRREWLVAYPKGRPQRWFERTYNAKSHNYDWELGSNLKGDLAVWRNATRPNSLFLSQAVGLNSEQMRPVFNWFANKLVVVTGSTLFNTMLTVGLFDKPNGKKQLQKFIEAADLGIADISLRREPIPQAFVQVSGMQITDASNTNGPMSVRIETLHKGVQGKDLIPIDLSDESDGTKKFITTAGAWLNVLSNGEVLFVDELDNSLHPLMVRFLINLFHRDSTNKKNAQLFFSTHDTSLLDGDIFRRDQIWFVEKDKQSATHLYSLLDFKPRVDEALGRGYLRGRYGALPFIGEMRL